MGSVHETDTEFVKRYSEFLRWIDETDFYTIIEGHNVSTKNLVHALSCAYDAIKSLEKRVALLEEQLNKKS